MPHLRRRTRLLAASAVIGLLPLAGACADDETPADGINTPEPGVEQTTPDQASQTYFEDDSYIGQEVTVTAAVDQDLTDESVLLNAGEYGDESLLVLFSGEQPEFTEGQRVTVTGTVRQFSYDDYVDDYGLGEAALFDAYADEAFLLAESITIN